MKTVFLRVLDADDKAAALRTAIREPGGARGQQRFDVNATSFGAVPRSPFAYWASDRVRHLFATAPRFQAAGRIAASGGKTLDDFRWLRASWEIAPALATDWAGFAKGGAFSPFYSDIHLLVDWRCNAASLKSYLVEYRRSRGWSPNWTAELHSSEHYFRPGLTWPRRSQLGFSLRGMPAGCVFNDVGPAAFVADNDVRELLALLAIANSSTFNYLIRMLMSFGKFEVGVV